MQIHLKIRLAILGALGALALAAPALEGAAVASQGQFTVRGVSSSGASITSVTQAEELLNGQIPSRTDITGQFSVINFNEPDHTAGGLFPNDFAFPGTSAGHENNFAIEATGSLIIPKAGAYTFGVSSDDGFSLSVGSNSLSFPGLRPPSESYATFTFAKAGSYPVDLVFFEHLVNAEVELFASPGSYTDSKDPGSNFQLVGGPSGLPLIPSVVAATPEPGSLCVVGIAALGLLRRRGSRQAQT